MLPHDEINGFIEKGKKAIQSKVKRDVVKVMKITSYLEPCYNINHEGIKIEDGEFVF